MPASFKAAFILNARNKASLVARAVRGALAQTYPCHILLSDQGSDDGTFEAMEQEVEAYQASLGEHPSKHQIELIRCPVKGAYGMLACNQHIAWLVDQTEAEWVFQCSADDYSLPGRVSACMLALAKLKAAGKDCAGIANTMYFEDPQKPEQKAVSGYPTETGYVGAGDGIFKMAYGSTIWGYRRDFLKKVDLNVPCTLDVYLGYLASLDLGYYVVCDPQHVHYLAADMSNMGFQGKMRAAEQAGDAATIGRINELNRFQLFELYFCAARRAQELYPIAHQNDKNALMQMMMDQACGWYIERKKLHLNGVTPEIM